MSLPERVIFAMARSAYETNRRPGASRPAFELTEPTWQQDACAEIRAAVATLEALGYRITSETAP